MPPFLLRMMHWVRNPPSREMQVVIALIVGFGLLMIGVEWFAGGWPDWLTPQRVPRPQVHGL